MTRETLYDRLADCPVIAAVRDTAFFAALDAPAGVIFLLNANLLTVRRQVEAAHRSGKAVFIHIDLADGIGKDRVGIAYLAECGADGIISTRTGLLRTAREHGLLTVQRFFALDSQGIDSMSEMLETSQTDLVEVMPGIATKIIRRFSGGSTPLIAGGLLETKQEITTALGAGAMAVSTGQRDLWYI